MAADKAFQLATQQGAAPDRLQLRSSFLLTPLSAAGELVIKTKNGGANAAPPFFALREYSPGAL